MRPSATGCKNFSESAASRSILRDWPPTPIPLARGPQVTIEEQFANNLSFTYSTNVSQSAQQIIQGEYYFNRNLSLVGTRDQNGVVSFDMQIRQRKK